MKAQDELKDTGCFWIKCAKCEWHFQINALDKRLPDGPFQCYPCRGYTLVKEDANTLRWVVLN